MQDITLPYLLSIPGAGFATFLLTNFLKQYFTKFDPKLLAGIVALILQTIIQAFIIKDYTASGIIIALINVPMIQQVATGYFENINHRVNVEKRK